MPLVHLKASHSSFNTPVNLMESSYFYVKFEFEKLVQIYCRGGIDGEGVGRGLLKEI